MERGQPSTRSVRGTERENTTGLGAINASGGKALPLVIVRGKIFRIFGLQMKITVMEE